jgi:hypothetical protein
METSNQKDDVLDSLQTPQLNSCAWTYWIIAFCVDNMVHENMSACHLDRRLADDSTVCVSPLEAALLNMRHTYEVPTHVHLFARVLCLQVTAFATLINFRKNHKLDRFYGTMITHANRTDIRTLAGTRPVAPFS